MKRNSRGFTLLNARRSRAGEADSTGFTIVEVLISLAITGLLLASAVSLLNGQTSSTTFQQSLKDIQTKLADTASGIGNGLLPNTTKYTCAIDATSGRPKLTPGVGSVGTNQACIFLGKAVQVTKDQSTLTVYTILGNRTTVDNTGATIISPDLDSAKPTPAATDSGNVLVENYHPTAGASLTAAKYLTAAGSYSESALAGLYVDPEGTDASNGQLLTKTYAPFPAAGASSGQVTNCVEGQGGCAASAMSKWVLCYSDGNSAQQAYIELTPGSSGLSTQLKFGSCPA